MAEVINKVGTKGPYPGRTWQQEADADKSLMAQIFPFVVIRKICKTGCDGCRKKSDITYAYCSKKCYSEHVSESKSEAEWESRNS